MTKDVIYQNKWQTNQQIIILRSMQGPKIDVQLENKKLQRIFNLQSMLDQEKKSLLRKVSKHHQTLLSSKKYRTYKSTLQGRVRMAENFVRGASESFFTMMADKEFLMITTEIDVIQKLDKFKKNVMNSLQKITHNLDSKGLQKPFNQRVPSMSGDQEDVDEQEDEKHQSRNKSRSRNKSKNFKISNDSSRAMVQWLLKNFENPYPTTQEKQKMAKQGRISMMKVNNWFINARERTVKGYFVRDS